ncbi:MAG: hypothetical protein NC094_05585 [Bacteroidales bacterium]|nr:hypothetical protein [Lachnoclostridium sp.]MCM1464874.1 hypothetical protein [Bacteroidales bacterium]
MKKLLRKLSDKLSVDGYNPLNGFNIFLSILSGLTIGLFIFERFFELSGGSVDDTLIYLGQIAIIVGIISFLLLLFRNRKLKKIPKIIIVSVVSVLVGAIFGILILIAVSFLLWLGGGNPENASGGQSSNESGGYGADEGSYTDAQNQAARNIGYSNAKAAEMNGKQWNGQSWS